MADVTEINKLQIKRLLDPVLRNINDCARYVKEDLEQGNIAGVQLWNSRLEKAQQILAEKSEEILVQQQVDNKVAIADTEMEYNRNECGVTS